MKNLVQIVFFKLYGAYFSGIFGLLDSWHLGQRLDLSNPTMTCFGLTDSFSWPKCHTLVFRAAKVEGCVPVNPLAPSLQELPWG